MSPSMRYDKWTELKDGHTSGVTDVAFSPKGNYIATAGHDNRVCIWGVGDHRLLHTMDGQSRTLSLAWQHNQEDALFCGMQDGTVSTLLFSNSTDSRSRSKLRAIAFPAHNAPVECLAVPQSRASFASGAHSELFIWKRTRQDYWVPEIDLGKPPQPSHTRDQAIIVTSIHWTHTRAFGPILLVTYLYHGVVVFDCRRWDRLRAIPIHGCIADSSISSDSRRLVVSNLASGFDIYDMDSWVSCGSLSNPAGGSTTGIVRIWDATNGKVHQRLPLGEHAQVLALSAYYDRAHDRFLLATGISDQQTELSVVLWKAMERRQRQQWTPRALYKRMPAILHWRTFAYCLGCSLLIGFASMAWDFGRAWVNLRRDA